MKTSVKSRTAFIIIAGIAVLVLGYQVYLSILHQAGYLNFGEVVPGKLYRSSQIDSGDLPKLVDKYGIKTIICLRGKAQRPVRELAKKMGLNVVGVQMTAEAPPTPQQLELVMKVLSESSFRPEDYAAVLKDKIGLDQPEVKLPGPFLIHCRQGADRTGYIAAVYRICFQGWSPQAARFEMLRYYHLPPRFPMLWQSLKSISPDKFCPDLNPNYRPAAATKP